jgi:hypothetical protein
MRKFIILVLLALALIACQPVYVVVPTATEAVINPTPSMETVTASPTDQPLATATLLPTMIPQFILWHSETNQHATSQVWSQVPECFNIGCRLYIDGGIAGYLGVFSDTEYNALPNTCYIGIGEATLDVRDNTCSNAVNNYVFVLRIHHSDGTIVNAGTFPVNSGVYDSINDVYDVVVATYFAQADNVYVEIALYQDYPCAHSGNNVRIRNVALQMADADFCREVEDPG